MTLGDPVNYTDPDGRQADPDSGPDFYFLFAAFYNEWMPYEYFGGYGFYPEPEPQGIPRYSWQNPGTYGPFSTAYRIIMENSLNEIQHAFSTNDACAKYLGGRTNALDILSRASFSFMPSSGEARRPPGIRDTGWRGFLELANQQPDSSGFVLVATSTTGGRYGFVNKWLFVEKFGGTFGRESLLIHELMHMNNVGDTIDRNNNIDAIRRDCFGN